MGLFRRRTIPANGRPLVAWQFEPDRFSLQAASLGGITNTLSPASVAPGGVRAPGYIAGDPGFGVNRWAGSGPNDVEPIQHFHGFNTPVLAPVSKRLGAGAGPSAQPGLPNTGEQSGGFGYGWPLTPGMGG